MRLERPHFPGVRVQQGQSPQTAFRIGTDNLTPVNESVGRGPKYPLWRAEFTLPFRHGLYFGLAPPVEVPPSSPIRSKVQRGVFAPLGLEDGLTRTAGNKGCIRYRSVLSDF